jgi:serine/threonine protein phosphatase PrpC
MPYVAHGVTHAGRRASNEDALLVDASIGLFVVADGMGGHRAGEVASGLAVQTIRSVMAAEPPSGDLLCHAVECANDQILAAASSNPDHAGMGTTVTALLISASDLEFVSVGDSRMYRCREGLVTQLTEDDSWLSHARAHGSEITEDEARRHPMRHVLTDVVGVRSELSPELQVEPRRPGDTFVLCSDGLHGAIPVERLSAILDANPDPQASADRLVQEALEHGATDNITVIVVRT